MAEEYEAEEERKRNEFLKAESEAIERHEASTKIVQMYRRNKAKRIVSTKRHQKALEVVMAAGATFDSMWVPMQKLVRRYVTRCWFSKRGILFKLKRKKKKKRIAANGQPPKLTFEELSIRVDWEIFQRRRNAREALFAQFNQLYVDSVTLLEANISHWLEKDKLILPDIERLSQDKRRFELVYTKQSEDLHNKDLMLKVDSSACIHPLRLLIVAAYRCIDLDAHFSSIRL